jgi:hypothetical protein
MNVPVTIDIFIEDDLKTIKDRIAASRKSLPEYIYIFDLTSDNIVSAKKTGTLTVRILDLLFLLRNKDIENFADILTPEVRNMIVINKLNILDDVGKPFIYYRPIPTTFLTPVGEGVMMDLTVDNVRQALNLGGEKIIFSNLKQLKEERLAFFKNVLDEIKNVRDRNNIFIHKVTEKQKLVCIPYLPFEKKENTYRIETNLSDVSIEAIFDNLVLNANCPLAYVNKFYKIFKDIDIRTLSYVQKANFEKNLSLRTIVPDVIGIHILDDFVNCYILENKNVVFRIQSKKENKDDIISKIKELFPALRFEIVKKNELSFTGSYLIPNQQIIPEVFSYLVMNDKRFSRNLYIDESSLATKTKEGIYVFYKTNISNETIGLIITPKTVQLYDSNIRGKDTSLFPINSNYLNVRIRNCESTDSVKEFQEYFCRLLSLYNLESPEVIRFYRENFMPEFLNENPMPVVVVQKKKPVTKLVPELFTNRYNRKCTNKVEVVSPEEAASYRPESVMLFPQNPEEGEQRLYACSNEKFPNIALSKNDPKSKFPFVPCCYSTDIRAKTMKEARDCPATEDKKSKQTAFITTDTTVSYNNFGYLTPFEDVNYVFKINEKENHHFIRVGMDRTKLSFLQCIFKALQYPYKNGGGSCDARFRELKAELNKISTNKAILCGKQAFPGKNENDIREYMLNENNYFSPEKFTDILEYIYQCKIFVFSSDDLLIPGHVQNYIINRKLKKDKTIFILEHEGSDGENLQYPQCELIVESNKIDSLAPIKSVFFENEDPIVPIVFDLFDSIRSSFSIMKQTMYYDVEDFIKLYATSQIFNSYGKTSAVIVHIKNNKTFGTLPPLLLYTENPMPPLPLEPTKTYNEMVTYDQIEKFLHEFISVKAILDYEGKLKMVKVVSDIGNTYYIPLEPSDKDNAIRHKDKEISGFSLPRNESQFRDFNFKKRIAAYLAEYAKYLLSGYAHEKRLPVISDKELIAFVNKFIILDIEFEYTNMPTNFGVKNEGFVRDGKIIVNSEELRTRLVYFLRVEKHHIHNYWQKKLIPIEYSDSLDFSIKPNEIILNGIELLMKYIREFDSDHLLSNKIIEEYTKPYIFQNDQISDNTPYLAINTDNADTTDSILYSWTTNKVISKFAEPQGNQNVQIYDYVNANNITSHSGQGVNKVLYYKDKQDLDQLTVLLRV